MDFSSWAGPLVVLSLGGNDVALGTPAGDTIDGQNGEDTLCGDDGDDHLSGDIDAGTWDVSRGGAGLGVALALPPERG